MNTDSEEEHILTDFQGGKRSCCSWCKQVSSLLPNKSYCVGCKSNMFRECVRCHLPFPDEKYFQAGGNRCNSCQKKYEKERGRRQQKLEHKETCDGKSVKSATKRKLESSAASVLDLGELLEGSQRRHVIIIV